MELDSLIPSWTSHNVALTIQVGVKLTLCYAMSQSPYPIQVAFVCI